MKLKSLKITNFKGIKSFYATFNGITNIYGKNEAGKTTILDSFLWLCFGKNSNNKSIFEIKPLDKENNFIKDVDSEVEAVFEVGGREIVARKVLSQRWEKLKGEPKPTYRGDKNSYFWNLVPSKESKFNAKIKEIIDENIFKLITNPLYFNTHLKWEERRSMVTNIAGKITNAEIFDAIVRPANKAQFFDLIEALNSGKTLEEFKKQIANQKKRVKDEAADIPSRIDEVRKGMPEDRNFSEIKNEIDKLETELKDIDNSMKDDLAAEKTENTHRANLLKTHNEKVQTRQQHIFDFKTKLQNIEFDARQQARDKTGKLTAEINSIERQIADKKLDLKKFTNSVNEFTTTIEEKNNSITKLRSDYDEEYDKELVFDDGNFVCPSCQQALPSDDIETKKTELTENFNNDKIAKLAVLERKAGSLKEEIAALNSRVENGNTLIDTTKTAIEELDKQLTGLKDKQASQDTGSQDEILEEILTAHADYQALKKQLTDEEAIVLTAPTFDDKPKNEALISKATGIGARLRELNNQLNDETLIARANARIQELEEQEIDLAQQLAKLEGTDFSILQFQKAEVNIIESRINSKFKYVTFKMFTKQVNGGTEPCCETLIKGVPFNDANNASKINAGIDIINALCKHYDVYAPIFIDNRESVTEIIDSDSQIINLIVSAVDQKLRVA